MNKIKLIIWREFITRVRKPSFLIMTILGPVLIAGGILLTTYLASQEATTHHVLVIDTEGVIGTRQLQVSGVRNVVCQVTPVGAMHDTVAAALHDQRFAELDANGDGLLQPMEIANAVASLRQLDRNRDGILSRDELRPVMVAQHRG